MKNIVNSYEQTVKKPSICVIISAYNAEKYIKEQIESILNQNSVDVQIWIRDDGSTDNTLSKLLEFYGDNSKVVITKGQNLGAAQSFLEAIFSCNLICNYYAFSDADDVWIADKTEHSIKILEAGKYSGPAAVVTRLQIVDRSLNFLGYTEVPTKGLSFKNALVQTVASGAATTMNEAAFKKIQHARPDFVVMHDAWTYLVITAFGRFYYSESAKLLYRQHGSNVFGANYSLRKRVSNRVSRLISSPNLFLRQAKEFYRIYGCMLDNEKKTDITRYLNYRDTFMGRLKFALFPSIIRQRITSNLYMRLLILFGKE